MSTPLVIFGRSTTCLGIAGCLAIASASMVRSQIPVTGGRVAGDGAFFVPVTNGNTVLFDANARFIRIETPNGVTVNSRFVPTAGVLNNTSGVPGRGAEGVLVGTLSGRAFTPTGSPIFFNNVSTRLGFSLTNFDPLFEAEGTLIRSQQQGAAPLVFVPASVSLSNGSSQNFNANTGELLVGSYTANLSSGSIDLPPTVRFVPSNDLVFSDGDRFLARGSTQFRLQGEGRGTTTVRIREPGTDTIDFIGEGTTASFIIAGTTNFASTGAIDPATPVPEFPGVQLTLGGQNFRIEGTVAGRTEFALTGNIQGLQPGAGALTGNTQFLLQGQGTGLTSVEQSGLVGFSSANSRTSFSISTSGLQFQGTASGEVAFSLTAVGLGTGTGGEAADSAFNENAFSGDSLPTFRTSFVTGNIPNVMPPGDSPPSSPPSNGGTPPVTMPPDNGTPTPPGGGAPPDMVPTPPGNGDSTPPPVTSPPGGDTPTPTPPVTSPPGDTPITPPPSGDPTPPNGGQMPSVEQPTTPDMPSGGDMAPPTLPNVPPPESTLTPEMPDVATPPVVFSVGSELGIFSPSAFSTSDGVTVTYTVYRPNVGEITLVEPEADQEQAQERDVVVDSDGRSYRLIGPPSRVFPGLTGVRELR